MILVDTSVWIQHFRFGVPRLADFLEQNHVLIHEMVIGELFCGVLKNRSQVLRDLGRLQSAVLASHQEVLDLIESKRLMGRGIGYVDAHLVASVLLTGRQCRLWTLDRPLAEIGEELKVGYRERLN